MWLNTKNVSALFCKNLKSSFLHYSDIWLWGFFTFLVALVQGASFPVVKSYLMIRLFYIKYDRALYSLLSMAIYYLNKSLGIVTKLGTPRRFINDSHDFILHCLSPSFLDLLHEKCRQVTPFTIDFWMEKSSKNFNR